jgi:DNA-binding transcriptional ArsR family regulator
MNNQLAVLALSAIAQESRLAVFRLLVEAGAEGLSAGKISELTQIAPSALSFHLKELTHVGMVTARQEGRFIYYSANFKVMNELLAFLTANCCAGNPCAPVGAPACLVSEE